MREREIFVHDCTCYEEKKVRKSHFQGIFCINSISIISSLLWLCTVEYSNKLYQTNSDIEYIEQRYTLLKTQNI